MQVILMDKVVNLGNLGDVVKVKDGYARNFLIPTGRARRATQANMEAFAAQKAELERLAAEKLADAQARAARLAGVSVTVRQKAGVDGRLFGSVTNVDIAEALKALDWDPPRVMGTQSCPDRRKPAGASMERSQEATTRHWPCRLICRSLPQGSPSQALPAPSRTGALNRYSQPVSVRHWSRPSRSRVATCPARSAR